MSNLEQQIEDFGAEALRIADERNEYKAALADAKARIAELDHECQASMEEIARERARADEGEARVKVLEEALEQKIARSDSIMKDIRRLLVRCHDRIHSLPRTSDTELAASIEQLLGRTA